MPPAPALNTFEFAARRSLARSARATAITLPVPRAGEAFPGAADAAMTLPENESKSTLPRYTGQSWRANEDDASQ